MLPVMGKMSKTDRHSLYMSDEASLRCTESGDRRVISTLGETQYVRPNEIQCDV